ncbi:MAG: alkaline phosphatase, partial [Flavobacteriaceae bacterium]|nr:alkaline phosphatase [Flavobacteriaceae bacterium]
MKHWKRTSLFTVLVIALLVYGIFYLVGLKIVKKSSGDVEFAPGENTVKTATTISNNKPKNIILFVADGFGFSHLSLSMMTQQQETSPTLWEQFDIKGWHDARSTYGPLTDSGASATAMATGVSTNFGVLGQDKDGNKVTNAFEIASAQGYNTGIVTDSYFWDATPAAFVAHVPSRDHARDIMKQYAASEVDIVFGELEDVGEDEVPTEEETLDILEQRFQLLDESLTLPEQDSILKPIAAIYEEDEVQDLNSTPNLTTLTDKALSYLTSQDKPFILLVECEEMDSGSHRNDSDRVVNGLKSIQKTLSQLLDFAKANGETLIVFTTDHETGGLAIVSDDNYPSMQLIWASGDHTA